MKLVTNSNSKIGRNDPCHCGSGAKYKKCCMNADQKRETAVRGINPANFQREMEQIMGKIGKIAQTKNMSIEDLNNYFVGRDMDDIEGEYDQFAPDSDREKAQEMIYEAFDMPSGPKRKQIAEEALTIYPHLPDAWVILSEENSTTPEGALPYYEKAIRAGESDLGEDFFKKNEGYFWGLIETRPYMRAKVGLAQVLWDLGREDEAITHYKDCLRLNPNDNQGVRDILTTCLLINNDLESAEQVLRKYKDDGGSQHAFNKALFLFKKYGAESKRASKQLSEAIEENVHVPGYLSGRLKLPKELPGSYAIGSKEEAMIYAEEALRAWKETPGALEWLARH